MTIGFYFECFKKSGGVYQYALNLLEALKKMTEHAFIVFTISPDFPFESFDLPNWHIVQLASNGKKKSNSKVDAGPTPESVRRKLTLVALRILRTLKLYRVEIFLTRVKAKRRARAFENHGLNLMIFHGPSELSFLTDIPSFVPIHDIHHRLHPESPEVSSLGQWEKREYLIQHIKETAHKILVNSARTKTDLIRCYGIEGGRIEVMPCPAPVYFKKIPSAEKQRKVIKKYNLPEKFLFYAAQFWPHKNHQNLIRALSILKKENRPWLPLVLVGSAQSLWGEFEKVKQLVSENGLERDVHFLGYVDNDEMPALYSLSTALVMPTLFGFTYPVFEAWQMNVPVIYSNADDSQEQVGGAALTVTPQDPNDIAQKIELIIKHPELGKKLAAEGQKKLENKTQERLNIKVRELIETFERTKITK